MLASPIHKPLKLVAFAALSMLIVSCSTSRAPQPKAPTVVRATPGLDINRAHKDGAPWWDVDVSRIPDATPTLHTGPYKANPYTVLGKSYRVRPSAEGYVERHGGKSLIIGRFVGPIRAFVPMAAGIFQMPVRRFLWYNFVSAVLWAPPNILPGYIAGAAVTHENVDRRAECRPTARPQHIRIGEWIAKERLKDPTRNGEGSANEDRGQDARQAQLHHDRG